MASLTEEQRSFSHYPALDTHGLVLACAGSGKTQVIIERCLFVIQHLKVHPHEIMAVTYTRAAGCNVEMRLRARLMRYNANLPMLEYCDTFHSIAHTVLKKYKMQDAGDLSNVDETLLAFYDFLKSNTRDALAFKKSLKLVFVDEYQDSNELMFLIAKELSEHSKIIAVGDDLQNIMSFQGSNVRFIREFEQTFQPCKTWTLSVNFRCSDPIIQLSNAVVANGRVNEYVPKPSSMSWERYLFQQQHKDDPSPPPFVSTAPKPRLEHCEDTFKALDAVVDEIAQVLAPPIGAIKPHHICILSRNAYLLHQAHTKLMSKGVKCTFLKKANQMRDFGPQTSHMTSIEDLCRDRVILSTMHGAKGLEFERGYILTLHKKFMPDSREPDLDAERRLLYVAITRFKAHCVVWNVYPQPSAFVRELYDQFGARITDLVDTKTTQLLPLEVEEQLEVIAEEKAEQKKLKESVMDALNPISDINQEYLAVTDWINSLNGTSHRKVRKDLLPNPLPFRIANIPLRYDPTQCRVPANGPVHALFSSMSDAIEPGGVDEPIPEAPLKPHRQAFYIVMQSVEDAIGDFLECGTLRFIQEMRRKQVAVEISKRAKSEADGVDSATLPTPIIPLIPINQYVFEPAEDCLSKLRKRGQNIPDDFKSRVRFHYERYKQVGESWKQNINMIYWTSASLSLRQGRCAMMYTPVSNKVLEPYCTILEEVERTIHHLLYDEVYAPNNGTHLPWQCWSFYHLPSNKSLTAQTFITVGNRLVMWCMDAHEFGSFPVESVMRAICYVSLLTHHNQVDTPITHVQVYHAFSRKICHLNLTGWSGHEALLDFLRTNKRDIYHF